MEVNKQFPSMCVELSANELETIDDGFITTFLSIAAVTGAAVAIYEAGKYTDETIYYLTH
jgi:hypothetical protein